MLDFASHPARGTSRKILTGPCCKFQTYLCTPGKFTGSIEKGNPRAIQSTSTTLFGCALIADDRLYSTFLLSAIQFYHSSQLYDTADCCVAYWCGCCDLIQQKNELDTRTYQGEFVPYVLNMQFGQGNTTVVTKTVVRIFRFL